MAVDICYVVSHGFSARMILHSGIMTELRRQDLSVALLVPHGTASSLMQMAERHGVSVLEAQPVETTLLRLYEQWRHYTYRNFYESVVPRESHVRSLSNGQVTLRKRLRAGVGLLVNWAVRKSRLAHSAVTTAERRILRDPGLREQILALRPRILVSTYPTAMFEAIALGEARNAGIRTVGHILSWDNITSKGEFPIVPDEFISWGPIMTEEISAHYGVPVSRIAECGVAHFDAHITSVSRERIATELQRLGLDPAKPYLLVGMSLPVYTPGELDIAEWLATAVQDDRFGPELQLVVRPHPQSVCGPYRSPDEWIQRLHGLPSSRVALDLPRFTSGGMNWMMAEDDLISLVNLLAGSAICINSGSTLTLESVIHNRPVILTHFDGMQHLPLSRSARRVAEYPHLAKLLRFGAAKVTHSFDELERAVVGYLVNPEDDGDARVRARQQEVGAMDGNASRRIAAALARLVRGGGETDAASDSDAATAPATVAMGPW
jgi:hypothetical protein